MIWAAEAEAHDDARTQFLGCFNAGGQQFLDVMVECHTGLLLAHHLAYVPSSGKMHASRWIRELQLKQAGRDCGHLQPELAYKLGDTQLPVFGHLGKSLISNAANLDEVHAPGADEFHRGLEVGADLVRHDGDLWHPLRAGRDGSGEFVANLVAATGLPILDQLVDIAHWPSSRQNVINALLERLGQRHAFAVIRWR